MHKSNGCFSINKASKINMKWVETTFPFTHPSWELEIEYKGVWYEVLVRIESNKTYEISTKLNY